MITANDKDMDTGMKDVHRDKIEMEDINRKDHS